MHDKYCEVASAVRQNAEKLKKVLSSVIMATESSGKKLLLPLEQVQSASLTNISMRMGWLSMTAMQKLLQEDP